MNKKIIYTIAIIAFIVVLIVAAGLLNKENTKNIGENKQTENEVNTTNQEEQPIKQITSENFEEEVLKSEKPVLVEFFATWCGPCKELSPIIEQVSKENDKIKVVKIDVDQEENIANKYKIYGMPTIILIKDGKEINRLMGLQNKTTLDSFINKNISK